MEDPRRDQTFRRGIESTRGGRHRKTEHTAAAHKWDRGHRVKQKDCSQDHWGPEAVEPLKTTFHRWDRKHKHANELEGSLNTVTAILNKMTPQSFEKLSGQLCKLEMTSSEMLRRVIGVIFDKAVDEPHFAVVYAALCARLAKHRLIVWARPVERLEVEERHGPRHGHHVLHPARRQPQRERQISTYSCHAAADPRVAVAVDHMSPLHEARE